jgi:methionyl-tRNA synthetase
LLTIFLKPILPRLAEAAEQYLNSGSLTWTEAELPIDVEKFLPPNHEFGQFHPLLTRIDPKQIDALLEANKQSLAVTPPPVHFPTRHAEAQQHFDSAQCTHEIAPIAETIGIDDFAKIDLRVAKILKAEHVEGADKLLKLTLDIGSGQRTVFAGIKSAYAPEQLEGRLTVMVANLAPRKMKFGVSEGMVLAAGPGGKDIYVLNPDSGALPGMRIK